MVLPALLLPQPVSHKKQHFATSARAVPFIAKPLNSPQAPLGACAELRSLHAGANKSVRELIACSVCVSPQICHRQP